MITLVEVVELFQEYDKLNAEVKTNDLDVTFNNNSYTRGAILIV